MQESKATQARVSGAKEELHNLHEGRFTDALEALSNIVHIETDAKGNSKGHGVVALAAIEQRLHMPARNSEQVSQEIALRLTDSPSMQARQLSKDLLTKKIQIPQRNEEQELGIQDLNKSNTH